jgi:hypothetical protein
MRLLKIWLRLLNTSLTVAYYRARLLNQRILFQLDEWFNTPVSSKEISASFDDDDTMELDIEEEFSNALTTSDSNEDKPDKPYKPYDGPVSMTP